MESLEEKCRSQARRLVEQQHQLAVLSVLKDDQLVEMAEVLQVLFDEVGQLLVEVAAGQIVCADAARPAFWRRGVAVPARRRRASAALLGPVPWGRQDVRTVKPARWRFAAQQTTRYTQQRFTAVPGQLATLAVAGGLVYPTQSRLGLTAAGGCDAGGPRLATFGAAGSEFSAVVRTLFVSVSRASLRGRSRRTRHRGSTGCASATRW